MTNAPRTQAAPDPGRAASPERGRRRRRVTRALGRALPPVRRLVGERDDLVRQVERLRRRNTRLRETQRALRGELRRARGGSRGRRADGEGLRYLFIVTYGRSGSTLLQGILSSIPGYLIRGENGGVVYQLYRFHTTASERSVSKGTRWRSAQSAWFGIGGYPRDTALGEIRRLVLATLIRPGPRSRVVGFKEIRWLQQDLHEYVEFLRAVFPGARFVVNTRDLDDVVKSKWWADDPDARRVLSEAETRMLGLVERLGDDAFHIRYDDYAHDPGRLRALFDWLGEDFDETRVAAAMAKRHSY